MDDSVMKRFEKIVGGLWFLLPSFDVREGLAVGRVTFYIDCPQWLDQWAVSVSAWNPTQPTIKSALEWCGRSSTIEALALTEFSRS